MEVHRFDARSASGDVLRQLHQLTSANLALDRPAQEPPTFELFVGRLRNPPSHFGEPTRWLAEQDGRVVGHATAYFPQDDNRDVGLVEHFLIDPAKRRRGLGTQLLRAVLPAMQAEGRTVVEFWAVAADGPGERWARARGCRRTHAVLVQELVPHQVDPALWDVAPPPGYRLVSWQGRCPDELVESFAVARTAIADAPTGESEVDAVQWTVAKVRAFEEELERAGTVHRTCVAVDEKTGAVAGLTLVEQHPHRRDWAYQNDTVVPAGHRGHGLGRCMKAAMARTLVAEIPQLRRVVTHTATTNVHMIATNHAIGCTDVSVTVVLTHGVQELARKLGEP